MASFSTPYYKALDFALIFMACSLAYRLRFETFAMPLHYFLPTTVLTITSIFTLNITHFYQSVNSEFSSKQIIAAVNGLTVSTMITIACLYLTKTGEDYSRIWLMTSSIFVVVTILLVRLALKKVFRISGRSRSIVLFGGGSTAEKIIQKLTSLPEHEIYVDKHFSNIDDENEKTLADIAEHIEVRRQESKTGSPIAELWITFDVFSRCSLEELYRAFNNSSVALVFVPELPDFDLVDDHQIQVIAGIPTINSDFSGQKKLAQLLKFIEDQAIAWTSLFILLPLLIVIGICIKLNSPGPALYQQRRYGQGGKSFVIWKFRTMYQSDCESSFKQAQKDDPRITGVGAFLRKTSLDELPQLINVINGTMSIVGPRPHPEALNEQYRANIDQYMFRHTFKPGITGLAQIKGFRGETADPKLMEYRVKYDLEYIKNWSLYLDLKILILTIVHIFFTKKAF